MILLVFEGNEREPNLYKTIERLYFPRSNNNIICSFGNNIYTLYKEMIELDGDGDIVSVLKEKLAERDDHTLDGMKSSDFSEIFLFFDYDFQNSQLTLEEINTRMCKMLALFNEETESGKLYVNYPMIESIRYTKELPDENYNHYVVSREHCSDFKRIANEFSYYASLDHILFKDGEKPTKERYMKIHDNWEHLIKMNVCKANYITNKKNEMPKEKIGINQMAIFEAQKYKYVLVNQSVAILNSFPIFVFEYFK